MRYDGLGYYLRRLRSVSPAEPFLRAGIWFRRRRDKCQARKNPHWFKERGSLWRAQLRKTDPGVDPDERIQAELEKRVPSAWLLDSGFWEDFAGRYPGEAAELLAKAEAVMEGRISFFQWKEIVLPEPIPWTATLEPNAPEARWPEAHHLEIDFYHDPLSPDRDVKWCWELNRFQHLLWLGAAFRLTGEERFAGKAKDHILSWIKSADYPLGVNFSSNLEVGLRLLSWARCHILCLGSESWDKEFLSRFLNSVSLQALHLESELTRHHPSGNHLLGEAAALLYLSVLYPGLGSWARRKGRTAGIINRLVPKLILGDGVYAEQSTGYFRFVAEFLLPLVFLSRTRRVGLSDAVLQRLAAGLDWIRRLGPDPARVPMIGDADSGLAIGFRLSDYWDFRPLLAAGGELLQQPGLFEGLEEYPAESFLMTGRARADHFAGSSPRPSPEQKSGQHPKVIVFPEGGYHISRDSAWSVILDNGPLGLAPANGHGHADGLAVIVHYKGIPLLVDPGTGVYNGPPEWRRYFRSTGAHNTVSLDGESQSRMLDTFRWAVPASVKPESPVSGLINREFGYVLLGGTLKWPQAVHTRKALHLGKGGVAILDRITWAGEHLFEWTLNLGPGWKAGLEEGGRASLSHDGLGLELEVKSRERLEFDLVKGEAEPLAGWFSRDYGRISPGLALRFGLRASAAEVLIELRPASGAAPCFQELYQGLPAGLAGLFMLEQNKPSE